LNGKNSLKFIKKSFGFFAYSLEFERQTAMHRCIEAWTHGNDSLQLKVYSLWLVVVVWHSKSFKVFVVSCCRWLLSKDFQILNCNEVFAD